MRELDAAGAAGGADPAGSDHRFETLFQKAPFSVQLLARDGHTLRVNRAWEELWQTSDGDGIKEYVLTEYNVLTDPQLTAKGVIGMVKRAFAGEAVTLPAIRYDPAEIGKTGRARWVRAHLQPVLNAAGEFREVMLFHVDVTEQVQAEQALQLSEMRLKQLANTIPQLVWMADTDGLIHWYNDRWYGYTGTTPEEMQGFAWQRLHDPRVLPEVMARWQHSLASGEPFQMTFPLRGKDGNYRPFFTLVMPLKDSTGKVLHWFGTNTDVSALHDAEENLRRAEERLRLATHAGGIGIWDWDIARDIVTWSDQVYLLHEIAPGNFGGRGEDFAKLVHPDDRESLWQKVDAAIERHDGFSAEFRIMLPDGRAKWLSTWARIHHGTDDQGSWMVGATISIDAYKQAEAALRDGDRRKDEFLAMLAHELRNPLAPISTAAQLIQLQVGDEKPIRRASEIISRQVRHISDLVDDLLDVSRVTRGMIQLELSAVEVKTAVASAIEQARPAIEARSHVLTTRIGTESARVHGDGTRLVQAIANLLDNASKYTPEGGEISLTLDVVDAEVHVTVTDNGTGIDADLLPHVFELFTQGQRSPSRSEGGLGIGLALVKSIVGLHGGRVQALSAGPGKGSTFSFALPLMAAPAASAPDSMTAAC